MNFLLVVLNVSCTLNIIICNQRYWAQTETVQRVPETGTCRSYSRDGKIHAKSLRDSNERIGQ